MRYNLLTPGDSIPKVRFKGADGTDLSTLCLGGQNVLLIFANPSDLSSFERDWHTVTAQLPRHSCVFVVIPGPHSDLPCALRDHVVFDPDLKASRHMGTFPMTEGALRHRRAAAFLFDPMLRLVETARIRTAADLDRVLDYLAALPEQVSFGGRTTQAPVLTLPRVFCPDLCAELMSCYKREARELSGVMRVVNGETVGVMDSAFKRRRDCLITDTNLVARIQARIRRAVLPELDKAFGFRATRMERYLVGSYCANDKAHFAPHRDNTTPATAHRRFAISINLNEDFEGGAVSFPEFGPDGIKAPAGAAVVFGCGLMHAVAPVTAGTRFAFLPFVYDEAGAMIRQAYLSKSAAQHSARA